jgi:putative transposase
MLKRQSFRFRLRPSRMMRGRLACAAGARRYLWNRALDLQKRRLDDKLLLLSYSELCALLVEWKQDPATAWLASEPSQPLQQVLKDLHRALREWLAGLRGEPKFKCKGKKESFRYPQGVKVYGKEVIFPKIGSVPFHKSREIIGTIKNVTVMLEGEHWFVAIQTECEVAEPKHPSTSAVGIDLGVAVFAALSDGTMYPSPKTYDRYCKALSRFQRGLARKQKGSNNYKKQKRRLSSKWRSIRNIRLDYLHKVTTEISKNHAIVYVEDLQVSKMSQSAKGTIEEPGKDVKKKAKLNRGILENCWFEFRRQLDYKLRWQGGQLIAISPRYTSQTCPECSHVSEENRVTRACFRCQHCGYSGHADFVAAKNILAVGHTATACGVNGLKRAIAQESLGL